MNYYLKALKNYALFTGRARRSEYWYFALFSTIVSVALSFTELALKTPYLSTFYSFAVMLPSIAVGIRRMHDVGKSGWFILIPIYDLILAVTPGVIGPNKYGEDPKGESNQLELTEEQY